MRGRLLFLAFLVVFFTTNVAFGETFNVTTPEEFQNALTIAQSNGEDDIINVAAGTYNITSTLTYSTNNGDSGHTLTIQGAGADQTVLDGGGSVRILYIDTGADDSGGDVTIKGMAFENGNANQFHGGAIRFLCNDANMTIENNTFLGNSAYSGGAVDASAGSGTKIINNKFIENSAIDIGGACSVHGGAIIKNNTFLSNCARCGGGMEIWSGTVTITNNAFSQNCATDIGGGVYVYSSKAIITNNTFSGNSADEGGGVYADAVYGTATITNNTFSGNLADNYGGGVYGMLYHEIDILNVYNNILFDNAAGAGGNDGDDLYIEIGYKGATVNLYNNDFSGNADFDTGQSEDLYIDCTDKYHHAGNIQEDPQFVDPVNGDFHIKPTSSCIDKGNNSAPELPSTDFEGNPRIINGTVDIGTDEYRNPVCGRAMPWLHLLLVE